ncbi:MAG TPA: SIS domain-containing protein [Phycisphaerales bacterium]|nr:SIS domain-containing protein [Phycisphaerales bacterium]
MREAAARPGFGAGELETKVVRQARECADLKDRFFGEHASAVVRCAGAMAGAFDAGARLFAMGNGGSSCDATHCSVEFMHPIIEKRPALPCIALTTDTAILTAVGNDRDYALVFSEQIRVLGRAGDIALAISTSGKSASVLRGLRAARDLGMLTVGFAGRDGGRMAEHCDHTFIVPSFSIPRIQEVHETLLHILWDMIHVLRGEEDVL